MDHCINMGVGEEEVGVRRMEKEMKLEVRRRRKMENVLRDKSV